MAKDGEKTIGKGLELLELVGRSRNGLRGKEIAETLGLPVSTVFRQLKFLAERGFLRNADGVYTLGGALIRLGNAAMRQNPLSRLAHPLLAALSEATCETVHLAERRGGSVVYIDKVEGSRPVRMGSMIGNTGPLYCTGVGKAILAFLPEAERGRLLAEIVFTACTPKTITGREELETEDVPESAAAAMRWMTANTNRGFSAWRRPFSIHSAGWRVRSASPAPSCICGTGRSALPRR